MFHRNRPPSSTTSSTTVLGATITVNSIIIGTTLILAGVALVGLLINSFILGHNVHNLYTTNHNLQQTIQSLTDQINILNASFPLPNETYFSDDNWWMANAQHPGQQFQWNASMISPDTIRNYAGPDVDGVMLLDNTLDPTFAEDQFAVVGSTDSTTRIEFDLSLIPNGTLRLFRWPNRDDTVATLADIIAAKTPEHVFPDNQFAMLSAGDLSKRAEFDASLLGLNTNRTVTFPDLDGTMLLIAGAQTLSHKTLDDTNQMSLVDSNFVMLVSATPGTYSVEFSADNLVTTDRDYSFPDLSGTFLLTQGSQTLENKILDNTNTIVITDSNLIIEAATAAGFGAQFDLSNLTQDRSFTFHDEPETQRCTIACLSDIETVLTNTTSIFLDSKFAIESVLNTSLRGSFYAGNLTADRTFTFPDVGGLLVFASQIPLGGTWTPVAGTKSGLSGTPTFANSFYSQVGNAVFCITQITGLTSSGFPGSIRVGGLQGDPSFTGTTQAEGIVIVITPNIIPTDYDAGYVTSVTSTNTVSVVLDFVNIPSSSTLSIFTVFAYEIP